jgi:hypothetical protein
VFWRQRGIGERRGSFKVGVVVRILVFDRLSRMPKGGASSLKSWRKRASASLSYRVEEVVPIWSCWTDCTRSSGIDSTFWVLACLKKVVN